MPSDQHPSNVIIILLNYIATVLSAELFRLYWCRCIVNYLFAIKKNQLQNISLNSLLILETRLPKKKEQSIAFKVQTFTLEVFTNRSFLILIPVNSSEVLCGCHQLVRFFDFPHHFATAKDFISLLFLGEVLPLINVSALSIFYLGLEYDKFIWQSIYDFTTSNDSKYTPDPVHFHFGFISIIRLPVFLGFSDDSSLDLIFVYRLRCRLPVELIGLQCLLLVTFVVCS